MAYEFIGFGNIHGPKTYEFIGFGNIHGPKRYEFIGYTRNPDLPKARAHRRPGMPEIRGPGIPGNPEYPAPECVYPGPGPTRSTAGRYSCLVPAVLKAKIKNKNPRIRAGIGPEPTISLRKGLPRDPPGEGGGQEQYKKPC
jgi:hypothetical protein